MSMLTEAHIDAVQACIDNAKAILARDGVNRDSLAAVKAHLLLLAAHDDLFAAWNFQILEDHAGAHGTIYRLAEDDDHSFAMFAVAQRKGNMAPPHDHTTWAMIAGVEGVEVNRFYERLDDGSVSGRAQIRETREEAIEKGTGVALMPDDIHSIHCLCDEPTLALHFYGRSIAHLPERKKFNMANGTYSHFHGQPNIHNL
ncbi:MAG: cysteine dioxygenase family protein [Alphaproteobacteria bacterium]|jgi:predicted metal-dependent enzyme (double-stranded beta helix superfamily)|nr:cysteine dioxygenase family protein [Alphaproteobacteria bacterium]MDP7174467.1 cysteine dioxygenase family protein [Alphaproteobacteria bacterium]MDP7233026.1 cysteine dioxygenase family protein [Alphaproteobacteria bacterium]MEE1544816.1 cysteine dioxygenase family protein [Alphaproteobacteria bacterium]|tara:strand:- start:868 stop:1467 length:600 start_codon:yes stop_codon:yes gene_type:complete